MVKKYTFWAITHFYSIFIFCQLKILNQHKKRNIKHIRYVMLAPIYLHLSGAPSFGHKGDPPIARRRNLKRKSVKRIHQRFILP